MDELIKTIGGVAGSIISVITLATLLFKPVRERLRKWVRHSAISEEDRATLATISEIKDLLGQQGKQNEQILKELASVDSNVSVLKASTRSTIKRMIADMYNNGRVEKKINVNDREALVNLYEAYHELGGNNYTTIIYNEMLDWEVGG